MTRRLLLTASILSLDPPTMHDRVAAIASKLDAVQLDIMDGRFVENITYGAEIVTALNTSLPLDVHLMVADPASRIAEFAAVSARHITFHAEAVPGRTDQTRLVKAIRDAGCTAGIAINPDTHYDAIQTMEIDLVLCMTVMPGKGGQAFIGSVLPKIQALRQAHPGLMIQIDGGINEETARLCIDAGADNLVIGSALFRDPDPALFLDRIRHGAA